MNELFSKIEGFDWDEGNLRKNWEKHDVTWNECEEVFSNEPILLYEDTKHATQENRYGLLGKTEKERRLFISFTIRGDNVRIISARSMNKNERKVYERIEKSSKI